MTNPQRTSGLSVTNPEARVFPTYDLEKVQAILPELIDGLHDAVLVVDRDRRVVAANRRYLQEFGARGEAILGLSCRDSVHCPYHGQGAEQPSCAACAVVSRREPSRAVHALPDASGTLRRWEVSFNPVLDEAGEVSHIVEVWRDITERSQLEGQLSHSERLAAIGMLAAGVAHEINNPMASILAGVESLKRWLQRTPELGPEAAAEAAEVLDTLERETMRSRETTDKLVLLAQPYTGASSWVDVNRAGHDTVTLLGYPMRKQNIRVVEAFDENLPLIWGRESGIRGIWLNLCLNAVQAMPEGGTLTLRSQSEGDWVRFEVDDTGPGIQPEHRDRIWNPFFTTKPPGQGTGLGLSITRTIVEKHGGSIVVDSTPGRGARFIVTVPRAGPGGQGV
jgi:PAS domain S-box-containing protein